MKFMDCFVTFVNHLGVKVGEHQFLITADTNIMARVFDLRAKYNMCEGIVRVVVDVALNKPGEI